jgi:hypothetical protein
MQLERTGGEGEIRTPDRSFSPYNGLANLPAILTHSENCGLYYIPQAVTTKRINSPLDTGQAHEANFSYRGNPISLTDVG